MGGVSNEREISLVSGNAVLKALREEEKLEAVGIDVADEEGAVLEKALKENLIDIVFIALHGRYGEDGGIQSFLEKRSIPYTGSGVAASAMCFNKYVAKQLLNSSGIATPQFVLLTEETGGEEKASAIGFPVVVKPCSGGSAIGISIVSDRGGLENAFHSACECDDRVLIEKYVPGREITVSLLGNAEVQVLPVIEIISRTAFYDYRAKYESGMSEHILPAKLPKQAKKKVDEIAVLTYGITGCRGFARIDMIVSEDGSSCVLDINTIPGLTPTSLFPEAARAVGMSLGKLCRKLLEMAMND
jgi:D-alanine-D-alanine ligase